MRRFIIVVSMITAASPALATRVNNLDHVPHTIAYEAAGTVYEYRLEPNDSVNLRGLPNGRMSLTTAPTPHAGGTLNGTGVLSRYLGNGRNQGVPVDQMDDYTIWPGGKLMLQRRMKNNGPQ